MIGWFRKKGGPALSDGAVAPVVTTVDAPKDGEDVTAEIEILRTGTFTAMDGQSHDITPAMLEQIVTTFDRDGSPVPAVVGHPKSDDPAFGWVRDLSVAGDRLTATLFKVDPGFAESVKEGRFRKVSVKLYSPDAPNNPVPGAWGLRHVGFLGAAAPAVSGLKPVEFAGDDTGLVEFQAPPAKVMEHPEVRRALARNTDRQMVEGLAEDGHIAPYNVDPCVAFMDGLEELGQDYAFADGQGAQKVPADWFRDFLRSLAHNLPNGQVVHDDRQDEATVLAFTAPSGYDVDRDRLDLHNRVTKRVQANGTTYELALVDQLLDDATRR